MNTIPTAEALARPDRRLFAYSDAFFRALLWALIVYDFLVIAIALVDWFRHPLAPSPYAAFGGSPAFRAFALFIGTPLISTLAALIVRRQRTNIAGLLLLVWGTSFASWAISVEIEPALYQLVSLPIGPWWMALIMTPIYFPDGKAFPRWLSPIMLATMVVALLAGAAAIMAPATTEAIGEAANPFFVPAAQPVSNLLGLILAVTTLFLFIAVFVSPLLRYRRADLRQRQQIKWFAWWSMTMFTAYIAFYMIAGAIYDDAGDAPALIGFLLGAAIGLIGLFPPLIIAVAILRHRLYDIDIIIRRTLLYTALTALLALVYFGSVVALQTIAQALTGQAGESPLIIVASTLLIAALVGPLRRRLQNGIDRRFYRQKYDAQQVLARFAQSARDEVQLERLRAELVQVVQETMQPEVAGVWLAAKERER